MASVALRWGCKSVREKMTSRDAIIKVIYGALEEINRSLPLGRRLQKSEQTILFGDAGQLDSLGLVLFIVTCEQRLNAAFASSISLADEKAISLRRSPFRTIGTFADYVLSLFSGDAP